MPDNKPIERKSLEQFEDEESVKYHFKNFEEIHNKMNPHVTDFNRVQYLMIKGMALQDYHKQEVSYYKAELENKEKGVNALSKTVSYDNYQKSFLCSKCGTIFPKHANTYCRYCGNARDFNGKQQ